MIRRMLSAPPAAFLLTILGVFLYTGCATQNQNDPDKLPNIIYIMADDLGYGDLGCYGQETIQTPNIDRLAKEGMRFTNHYSGHTVCRCSRLSLWTGHHTGNLPIHGNAKWQMGPTDITIAKLLQEKGYATGGVGKWSLGDSGSTGHPNLQGFDFWMGFLDQSEAHNYFPTHLWRNSERVPLAGNVLSDKPQDRGRVAIQKQTYSHDLIADEALAFIRQNKINPFLLHVHITLPHANNESGNATGDGMEIPDYGVYSDEDWPNPEKGLAAMVTKLDSDVGRITALLEELGLRENTIIFFTSDNGPHQEGGHQHEFFDSNGPLRGLKRDLYDGGIRVPLIVSWPGHILPNSSSDHPSAFWDYLPTACELAGVQPPDSIDGISYLPTLLNTGVQKQHDYLYWKFEELGVEKVALRSGRWKVVRPATNAAFELYDLSVDNAEQHNLADEQPAVLSQLKDVIASLE